MSRNSQAALTWRLYGGCDRWQLLLPNFKLKSNYSRSDVSWKLIVSSSAATANVSQWNQRRACARNGKQISGLESNGHFLREFSNRKGWRIDGDCNCESCWTNTRKRTGHYALTSFVALREKACCSTICFSSRQSPCLSINWFSYCGECFFGICLGITLFDETVICMPFFIVALLLIRFLSNYMLTLNPLMLTQNHLQSKQNTCVLIYLLLYTFIPGLYA